MKGIYIYVNLCIPLFIFDVKNSYRYSVSIDLKGLGYEVFKDTLKGLFKEYYILNA